VGTGGIGTLSRNLGAWLRHIAAAMTGRCNPEHIIRSQPDPTGFACSVESEHLSGCLPQ